MIVAGIGSRKGVSAAEVVVAVETALKEHGLERGQLAALATMEIKRGEEGIFEAGEMMGLEVVVVPSQQPARGDGPPPLTPPRKGEGDYAGASAASSEMEAREALESPSPLRGGVRGGGGSEDASRLERPHSSSPPEGGEERSLSFAIAGVSSVSEAAALAAAGEGARLAGPRMAVGRVTCAIAIGAGA